MKSGVGPRSKYYIVGNGALKQLFDFLGTGCFLKAVSEIDMHDLSRQLGEDLHVLITGSVLVEGQHDHKLCLVVAPKDRLGEFGDTDG